MKFLKTEKGKLSIITLAYVLWALCYPPFKAGPLSFIVLVPILLVSSDLTVKRAFWFNFLGAFFYNTIMYYWIYNVMKVGPAFVILLGLLLLIIWLSLFNAYLGMIFRIFKTSLIGLLAFPVFWAGLEAARAKGQMSFPWNNIGYTLGGDINLIQITSETGVYVLSALIVGVNVLVFFIIKRSRPYHLIIVPFLIACLWIYGKLSLMLDNAPSSGSADISLVQPSVEQTKKWDEEYFKAVMDSTYAVMDRNNMKGTDLIVLAETAIPAFFYQRPEEISKLRLRAENNDADLIVGSLDFKKVHRPAKPFEFYNCAFMMPPDSGMEIERYVKLRLVPFSERLPFDDIFPILNYVDLGEGDFSAGTAPVLWGDKFVYSPSICYEIVYPQFVRDIASSGADLMVNITNDGWFGNSTAPYQHANICRFRAVETGLPIARCANNGISVFYDHKGRILSKTELYDRTVLRQKMDLKKKTTIYNAAGTIIENFLFWFWVLVNLWLCWKWGTGRYGKLFARTSAQ